MVTPREDEKLLYHDAHMHSTKGEDECTNAYIAGFLDGGGCLNAQIITRDDYRLLFEVRVTITFYQKSKRDWFLLWLKKEVPRGKIRKGSDGMSKYILTGAHTVKPLLQRSLPYLKLKRAQANTLLHIIDKLPTAKDAHSFLELCRSVDHFAFINDSVKRKINTEFVKQKLQEEGILDSP